MRNALTFPDTKVDLARTGIDPNRLSRLHVIRGKVLLPREPENGVLDIRIRENGLRPNDAAVAGHDPTRDFMAVAFLNQDAVDEDLLAQFDAVSFQLGNHLFDQEIRAAAKREDARPHEVRKNNSVR